MKRIGTERGSPAKAARAAMNEQGSRTSGGWRAERATPPPQEQSWWSKDLEGEQPREGRPRAAGNGVHWYGPIGRKRSWQHEASAGGGNPPRGSALRGLVLRVPGNEQFQPQGTAARGCRCHRRGGRNVANSRIGSGMQQARESCTGNGAQPSASGANGGENRRDRAKR